MTLQNRVDPFGAIHADPARGSLTGNRGIIHDCASRTLGPRRWTSKAWIFCRLDVAGRRRAVMAQRRWTELFFLDEATALAAGHRPCFLCRRAAAKRFRAAWADGNGVMPPCVAEMDGVLHRQRLACGGRAPTLAHCRLAQMPDGTMIAVDGAPHLLRSGAAWPWFFAGYGQPVSLSSLTGRCLLLVTPPATVAALGAGYEPDWADSRTKPMRNDPS